MSPATPEAGALGERFARAISDDIESEPFLDRHHLRYRFRVENDDGMHVVEQQAYFTEVDGRITRMSVMCSGFRPDGEPTTA
jgi:hypothetical protein